MNSAQEMEFQWIVLCFLVTSMTAMVAPLETAPTRSLTPSWRISFSALRTAGPGLVSSSSETTSSFLPRTPPLAFSSSTARTAPIVWYLPYPSNTPTFEPRSPILMVSCAGAGEAIARARTRATATLTALLTAMVFLLDLRGLWSRRAGPRRDGQRRLCRLLDDTRQNLRHPLERRARQGDAGGGILRHLRGGLEARPGDPARVSPGRRGAPAALHRVGAAPADRAFRIVEGQARPER